MLVTLYCLPGELYDFMTGELPKVGAFFKPVSNVPMVPVQFDLTIYGVSAETKYDADHWNIYKR